MNALRNLPIARKLTLITLISAGTAIVISGIGYAAYQEVTLRRENVDHLTSVCELLAATTAIPLAASDAPAAGRQLRSLAAERDVMAACLYNRQGSVIASYQRDPARPYAWPKASAPQVVSGAEHLTVISAVALDGAPVGSLYVDADLNHWHSELVRTSGIIAAATLISLAIAWGLARQLRRIVTEPIRNLAEVAHQIAHGRNYSVRVQKHANDEIGELVEVFNAMLAQIETRETQLEQRVEQRTRLLKAEIAERARAQEELKLSEYFLRKTQEVARLGSYVLDIPTGQWTATPVLREILGIDDTFVRDLEGWSSLVAPDQRDEMVTYFREHVLGRRQRFDTEYRIVRRRDQEERWVYGAGELEYDANGVPIRMIGSIRDVTDRRRAEAAQRASEEKYRRLTEEITDVVWEVDAEERFTYISPADEVMRGYRADEILGHCSRDYFDEETVSRLRTIVKKETQNGGAIGPPNITFEARQRCKDGHYIWTEVSARRFLDATGKVVGFRGTTRDITARKQMEAELHVSQIQLTYERDQLQALLEATPDAIYFKDQQSRFVRISRSKALRILEVVPALRAKFDSDPGSGPVPAVLGRTDFDIYNAEDAQRAFDDEQQIIRTGQPLINKVERQVFQDGTVVWHLTSKMPWRDSGGNILGTLGISKDITDLKQAEENLERVHKELVEASRQAGMAEVATGVLHNVGNALNSVNVSASLLLDEIKGSHASYLTRAAALLTEHANDLPNFLTADPRGRKLPSYLAKLGQTLEHEQQRILRELESLRRNVDHIKEIVAMQQTYAKVAGVIEPVPIVDVIEDAIRMNSAAFARHEVELIRAFAANPVIPTDRHKLLQILVNLLRNAKYACDESGRTDKRITIGLTSEKERVRVSVADNGVGIPPENLVRIFSHGFTTRKGGHGFGLHSGALAAKELGGSLVAQSAGVAQGALFSVDLPLTPPPSR